MLKDIRFYFLVVILIGFIAVEGCSSGSDTTAPAPAMFARVALTSNTNEYGAANVDTSLQDAWGMTVPIFGGFWIVEKSSGMVSSYDSTGKPLGSSFHVNDPGSIKGQPTGVVTNASSTAFLVTGLGPATFIFSTLNGTISVRPQFLSGDSTKIILDRSANSSYTGLAIATGATGPKLFAPNIKNQSLDVIDQNFTLLSQFPDRTSNYTPFNAVVIDTQLFVTHAMKSGSFVQLGAAGAGMGSVDIFDLNGNYEKTLIATGGKLISPWGLAIAPSSFGTLSGKLLVGNFGDGKINAYDRSTGAYVGTVNDVSGNPLVIEGLWALTVYNNTLYYTAGPEQGKDGEFGKIVPR